MKVVCIDFTSRYELLNTGLFSFKPIKTIYYNSVVAKVLESPENCPFKVGNMVIKEFKSNTQITGIPKEFTINEEEYHTWKII